MADNDNNENLSPPLLPQVGGLRETSLEVMETRALQHIAQEETETYPDTQLIALLCDLVRLCRERQPNKVKFPDPTIIAQNRKKNRSKHDPQKRLPAMMIRKRPPRRKKGGIKWGYPKVIIARRRKKRNLS